MASATVDVRVWISSKKERRNMKQLTLIGLLATCVFLGSVYAQEPSILNGSGQKPSAGKKTMTGEELTEAMIGNLICARPYTYNSPRLKRMGDRAAVTVNKLIAGRTLNENEQLAIAGLVQHAFENPVVIGRPVDRQPAATMSLLDSIERSSEHAAVKLRVIDAKQRINSALALANLP
jgi:hypothetical protein